MNERESEIYANSKWILRNLFDAVLISAMNDVLCKHVKLRSVTISRSESGCEK